MRPSFQSLRPDTVNSSFSSYWVHAPWFGFHWHYHPEFELCYVDRGAGTRMVGDSVREFADGDLVLVGSNLPHTWISQNQASEATNTMQVYVIQFLPDLFTQTLLNLPEFGSVGVLLRKAAQGIFFKNGSQYKTQLDRLNEESGMAKFLSLINLLHRLSVETATETLANPDYSPVLSRENETRMQNVFGFIHARFTQELSLYQIADIACMNEASFCRYFKKNTGQTLTEYINDLRINQACQLLLETRQPITAIAHAVGFNSFTNFNKSFVRRKGLAPREYRKGVLVF